MRTVRFASGRTETLITQDDVRSGRDADCGGSRCGLRDWCSASKRGCRWVGHFQFDSRERCPNGAPTASEELVFTEAATDLALSRPAHDSPAFAPNNFAHEQCERAPEARCIPERARAGSFERRTLLRRVDAEVVRRE